MQVKIFILLFAAIWICIISFLYFDNKKGTYENYVIYGKYIYELEDRTVFKFNKQQYLDNNEMTLKIINPNIMVVVIFIKNNYKCSGLIGQRQLYAYTNTTNMDKINLLKNSTCFPEGGLEPEYMVVMPRNSRFNSYWVSMYYKPTNNISKMYKFLVNYK